MVDLEKMLGGDNPLVVMWKEARNAAQNSRQGNVCELALAAGIDPKYVEVGNVMFKPYEGKSFCLSFEATLPEDHEHYWCAEIFIDEGVNDDSPLKILIQKYKHEGMDSGDFNLCGLPLPVKNGRTSCTLQQLREGLKTPKVSFRSERYGIVFGHLWDV